jgi:anti-sigma B factor antagonist/stage II sporulation protein AA (anti-sigma F factor antagonist)
VAIAETHTANVGDDRAMNFRDRQVGSVTIGSASGRIDLSNADAFKDSLSAALSKTKAVLVLDLSELEYISSAGLRSLMIAFKAAKAEGKAFSIASLKPLVLEIFTISRFNLVFPLFDTVRDAIKAQAPDALAAFDRH